MNTFNYYKNKCKEKLFYLVELRKIKTFFYTNLMFTHQNYTENGELSSCLGGSAFKLEWKKF